MMGYCQQKPWIEVVSMRGRLILLIGVGILLVSQHARAVIKADTPLKAIEGSAVYVVVGKVDKYFADKPAMFVEVSEDIKGKTPYRKLPINLKVTDPKTFEKNQIGPLLKRLGPDQEIIFFISAPRGKNFVIFAFTNGTWFQLQATMTGKDEVVLGLTSAEPYFRRSFKGTTDELRKLLKEHADGKAKLPDKIDEKVEPGFGPEYEAKKGAGLLPSPPVLRGRGAGGEGGVLMAVDCPFCEGRSAPLTPNPSPPEYRGRGEKVAGVRWVVRVSSSAQPT